MKAAVIKYDFIQIRKDPMLLASIIAPGLFWLILRFGFPALSGLFRIQWEIDIDPYFNHAGVVFLTLIPMMFGLAYGFMLLDERDEGIITAISVTPMGRSGYMRLRMGGPVILSFILILIFCMTLGIPGTLGMPELFILAGILSISGPMMVLFLGAFARNKVEGVALSKGFGILFSAILVDYLVPSPYNWLGAFSPLFWVERAYFSIGGFTFIFYSVIGALFHLLILGWLLNRFSCRVT